MAKNKKLFNVMLTGRRKDVAALVQAEIAADADVTSVLMESMLPVTHAIGTQFPRNEISVLAMQIAACAMQADRGVIDSLLSKSGHEPFAEAVAGIPKGNQHDTVKNQVAMMMKGTGYKVMNCGTDCDVAGYDNAMAGNAPVLMLSALPPATMPYIKEVVDHFKTTDSNVKILIGGAPIAKEYVNQTGTGGYTGDTSQAVAAVEKIFDR
ncbi:MAG: cobalamin-dependent protein [Kiritimatiellales bacterium]